MPLASRVDTYRLVAPDKDLALHIWAGKTVEVRRSEAADARGVAPTSSDLERLFFTAVSDRRRLQAGLPLMPAVVPPPPPVTECAPRGRHFLPLGLVSCLVEACMQAVSHPAGEGL